MSLHKILSKNIRELRKRNNLTQAKLAELCEISNTFVGEIETGIKYPAPKTFEKLAEVLNVEPYVLLLPKDIVINEVGKIELLHMFTEEIKEIIQIDLESVLTKYLGNE